MMAAQQTTTAWCLSQLLAGLAPVAAEQDRSITGLSLDSRNLAAGDLFLACAGHNSHGLDFVQQALDRGAIAIVCEPGAAWPQARIETLAEHVAIPVLCLSGLGRHISAIAARFYGEPSQHLRVIGVTGTNGKTSCSQFLAQALSATAPCAIIGTLGNGFPGDLKAGLHTTPEPVELQALLAQLRQRGARAVAMEVSSHALDQGRTAAVHFDTALLTNLSRDHLDFHGSMADYAAAKLRLFHQAGLRCAILNLDDPFGWEVLSSLPASIKVLVYGLNTPTQPLPAQVQGTLWTSKIEATAEGMRIRVQTSWGEGAFSTRLLGRFNVSNLLAVLAVLLEQGLPLAAALERLERLETVPGRMERFGGDARPLVVVDYAHTPDALEQVIQALRPHCRGRLLCLFGCGGQRDTGKRPLMGAIAERLCDAIILTDDNPRNEDPDRIIQDILAGLEHPERAQILRNRADAIRQAIAQSQPGDLILISGKGHESYQQYGDLRLPFCDREQVRQALTEREGA